MGAASVEESNDSFLIKSIKNPFVPWIFCEFIAVAHPEQINQTCSGQLPIYCVSPKSKREHYEHEHCVHGKEEEECLEREELELTSLLFRLLKENPSCAKIAVKNLNEMRNESCSFHRSSFNLQNVTKKQKKS